MSRRNWNWFFASCLWTLLLWQGSFHSIFGAVPNVLIWEFYTTISKSQKAPRVAAIKFPSLSLDRIFCTHHHHPPPKKKGLKKEKNDIFILYVIRNGRGRVFYCCQNESGNLYGVCAIVYELRTKTWQAVFIAQARGCCRRGLCKVWTTFRQIVYH